MATCARCGKCIPANYMHQTKTCTYCLCVCRCSDLLYRREHHERCTICVLPPVSTSITLSTCLWLSHYSVLLLVIPLCHEIVNSVRPGHLSGLLPWPQCSGSLPAHGKCSIKVYRTNEWVNDNFKGFEKIMSVYMESTPTPPIVGFL